MKFSSLFAAGAFAEAQAVYQQYLAQLAIEQGGLAIGAAGTATQVGTGAVEAIEVLEGASAMGAVAPVAVEAPMLAGGVGTTVDIMATGGGIEGAAVSGAAEGFGMGSSTVPLALEGAGEAMIAEEAALFLGISRTTWVVWGRRTAIGVVVTVAVCGYFWLNNQVNVAVGLKSK